MAIGKRITIRLGELGQSQAWLARRARVGTATISAIVRKDSKRTEFVAELAHALGVNTQWLQSGQGPKEEAPTPGRQSEEPLSADAIRVARQWATLDDGHRKCAATVIDAFARSSASRFQESVADGTIAAEVDPVALNPAPSAQERALFKELFRATLADLIADNGLETIADAERIARENSVEPEPARPHADDQVDRVEPATVRHVPKTGRR